MEHHKLTKKKLLNEFSNRPGIKVAKDEKLSLMQLEKNIDAKYPSYEKRAYVSNFFFLSFLSLFLSVFLSLPQGK